MATTKIHCEANGCRRCDRNGTTARMLIDVDEEEYDRVHAANALRHHNYVKSRYLGGGVGSGEGSGQWVDAPPDELPRYATYCGDPYTLPELDLHHYVFTGSPSSGASHAGEADAPEMPYTVPPAASAALHPFSLDSAAGAKQM